MKKLTLIIFTIFSSMSFASDIEKSDDGFYWKQYDSLTAIFYQVDTISQVCYALQSSRLGVSLATIDCKNLAKRKEWQEIITWLPK